MVNINDASIITKIMKRVHDNKMKNVYTSIITTHQARLRCFLHKYVINDNNNKMNRFQNGCIIKFTINPKTIEIELLYNGEIDEEKADYVYYVKPGTKDTKADEGKYQIQELPKITVNNDLNLRSQNTYTFYLIRHGQAEHNLLKGIQKVVGVHKNTNLTDIGILQAENSGKEMVSILNNTKINYLFASDLSRTHQTMNHFIKNIPQDNLLNKEIIVLPCSHELKYVDGSKCDGNQGYTPTPNENISTCTNETCKEIEGIPVNWNYYDIFYGEGTRNSPGNNRQHCSSNNMIELAIELIHQKPIETNKTEENKETDEDINTYLTTSTPTIILNNEKSKNEEQLYDQYLQDEDINTYTPNPNYKDEHLTKIITQALNTIEKKSINKIDPEEKTFIDDIPYVNTYIPSEDYQWKDCVKHRDFKEPTIVKSITEQCKTHIKKKNDAPDWNIVTILNNKECIIYNSKTKENQIIDIETGDIHKEQFINTIVKSVLRH